MQVNSLGMAAFVTALKSVPSATATATSNGAQALASGVLGSLLYSERVGLQWLSGGLSMMRVFASMVCRILLRLDTLMSHCCLLRCSPHSGGSVAGSQVPATLNSFCGKEECIAQLWCIVFKTEAKLMEV